MRLDTEKVEGFTSHIVNIKPGRRLKQQGLMKNLHLT